MKKTSRLVFGAWPGSVPRGTTLLEVAVAAALFALLISIAFGIGMRTTRSCSEIITESDLQVKGERTLKTLMEALTESTQLTVFGNWSGLVYYVPVDADGNGTVINGTTGAMDWGAVTEVGTEANRLMWFRFVRDYTLSEATEKVDLNSDGDMNDSFDIGYIERLSQVTGDVARVMGVTNVVQRAGDWGASILADVSTGDDGKLFRKTTSNVLEINLYLLSISEDRIAHLIRCSTRVFLRNQV